MTGDRLPEDPFSGEDRGERLLLALIEAALAPEVAPLARALGALDERDLRAVVTSQVLNVSGGIRDAAERHPVPRGGRLRRAWRAAVEEWRR